MQGVMNMRKDTRTIVVGSLAAVLLLTIGALGAYSWTLNREVAHLRGGSAGAERELLQESDDEYRVIISIAKGSEVELATELEDNTLSISAQVRSEVRHQGGAPSGGLQSTSISQFSRSIPLDAPVDVTGLQTKKSPEEIVIPIPKIG